MFAVRQALIISMATVISLAMFVLTGWALVHWGGFDLLGVLIAGTFISLPTLGYLFWAISNDWHGLIRTPRSSWSVRLDEGGIVMNGHGTSTRVPNEIISRVQLISDGSWETLRGVEDRCLLVYFNGWWRISVPGSSDGFADFLTEMRAHPTFTQRELG